MCTFYHIAAILTGKWNEYALDESTGFHEWSTFIKNEKYYILFRNLVWIAFEQ